MAPTVPVSHATRGTLEGNPLGERPMAEDISWDRRRFLGTAAMTLAAARLGLIGAAGAQPRETTPAAVPMRSSRGRTRRAAPCSRSRPAC
jgi:hypothetical protein